jgi:hypothetical protein
MASNATFCPSPSSISSNTPGTGLPFTATNLYVPTGHPGFEGVEGLEVPEEPPDEGLVGAPPAHAETMVLTARSRVRGACWKRGRSVRVIGVTP